MRIQCPYRDDRYSPFLRKLHGAFFALFAKTARCSGVNSYLCEYLHVDYIVAASVFFMLQRNRCTYSLKAGHEIIFITWWRVLLVKRLDAAMSI